ncbi:IclR family transcriptional regulator [Bifidobacterium pullorum subsp. saeculare]|uniref:Glycerol operon regulatory protein n=1 Tax=Bifidobacterium pullorum subsp. saeculare TaxID=78257 RepID=A0A939B7X1_9BIFI|nr:IclR family transcriptional regulator [Bifidobacterium pullorum]MBM6699212.1 IclR family transcriptional regulator [Bifidobacterium pullorum subsp. saeculare]
MANAHDGANGGAKANVGVLDRVMAILDLFSLDEPELSLTQISRKTGLAVSTVHRLVKDMCRHGMLERQEDGRYAIGLHLSEIGMPSHPMLVVSDAASGVLDDLNLATRQQVQLAALQGGEAVVLSRRMERGRRLPTFYCVGGTLPLVATGVGRVLLAYADERVRHATLADGEFPWAVFTTPRPSVRSVLDDCEDIVRRGYCVFEPEGHPVWSIAAPVLDARRRVVAAVGILYAPEDKTPRLLPMVRSAALNISRRMPRDPRQRDLPNWGEELPGSGEEPVPGNAA